METYSEKHDVLHPYQPKKKQSVFDQLCMYNAIATLNVEEFRRLSETFGVSFFGQGDDSVLKTIHIARMHLNHSTTQQKAESENWLRFRNIEWRNI